MLKQILIASLCLFSIPRPGHAGASLTAQETRWLTAAAPVLAYSQRLRLPVDIIVQPSARPGDMPLAIGFDGARCKLVLSLRGNPQADAMLDKVPAGERALLIEAMTAHEIGHCWRYAHGVWHALPAGFVERGEQSGDSDGTLAAAKAMRESRREEGYADLVALAWTWRRHPDQYGRVYRWLESVRAEQPVARNAHDTRAWVALARDGSAFERAATPFDDVASMWSKGLLLAD